MHGVLKALGVLTVTLIAVAVCYTAYISVTHWHGIGV